MTQQNDRDEFPAGALPWIASELGGRIVDLRRMVVRREAWRVEIERPDGGRQPYFLRIDRDSAAGRPYPRNLKREAGLIRWLSDNTGIPTQKIHGWNDEHCVAIQSFEPGRADLHNAPREEQHAVMLQFMDIMAEMHRVDVAKLDLPEFEVPPTPEDHSFMELRAVFNPVWDSYPIDSTIVLGAFGKRWMENHVPRTVERTVLLQGDTGPGNFMFENGRVTAVVDWEWAHYGDPMEDIGNLWLRDFFTPSCGGDMTPYVQRYAAAANVTLDRQKAIYYLVHQLVRSVITLPLLVRRPDWKSTVALNLGYQAVCDITCCEAMGMYHGIAEGDIELLSIPERNEAGELYQVLAEQLEKGVLPQIEHAFARATAKGAADMARYLERVHLYGPQADRLELAGIDAILGARHADLAAARHAFKRELAGMTPADDARVLAHCWGVARRNMQLMGPLVDRWGYCKLPRLD